MTCAEYVTDMGREDKCTQFGGKTEGERLFGRSRHRWEDNIKMDLTHTQWEFCGPDSFSSVQHNVGFHKILVIS
jgi:hypothetical protein